MLAQSETTARTAAVLARPNDKAHIGHVVTLRFAGLPGPIAGLSGSADFQVANIDCVAIDYERAPGGIRLTPEHRQGLAWKRAEDGSYSAVIYEDAFVDENYYKLGLCRWRLDFVTVRFQSATTMFVAAISLDEVRNGARTVKHYLVRDWIEKPKLADWVFGEGPDYYLKSLGPQFTLTMSARKLH